MKIEDKGVFPPADQEAEQESQSDALAQMSRGALANYTSVQENVEDAKIEIDRLERLGFLLKVTKEEVRDNFSQGTPWPHCKGEARQIKEKEIDH